MVFLISSSLQFGFFCVKFNPAFFNILYLDLLELANINFWCISVLIKIIVINTIKYNLNLRNSSFVLKMCFQQLNNLSKYYKVGVNIFIIQN